MSGMSRLDRKLISDKLVSLGKKASRSGDQALGASLVNIASVILYGRPEIMKIILASTTTSVQMAKELIEDSVPPNHNFELPDDPVGDKLHKAANTALMAGEIKVASIVEFLLAIRTMEQKDYLQQLYDAAASLSSKSVGKTPEKELLLVKNDFDLNSESE
jgi:hypothetical protein